MVIRVLKKREAKEKVYNLYTLFGAWLLACVPLHRQSGGTAPFGLLRDRCRLLRERCSPPDG